MVHIGIGEKDEGIFRAVRGAWEGNGRPYPHMVSGRYLAEFETMRLDLLVVSPLAGEEQRPQGSARCRCLLLPGDAGPLGRQIESEYAVSYGTSPKDTLTFSSLEGDRASLALQRELVTLEGRVVEEQELVLPFSARFPPKTWLAAVGVLLLCGLEPETLAGQ